MTCYLNACNSLIVKCYDKNFLHVISHHFIGEKLASSCSQARTKLVTIYTGNVLHCKLIECGYILTVEYNFMFYVGNERAIVLFLLFEFALLVVLIGLVRFCCTFWAKRKLKDQGLGSFLAKRVSSRSLSLFFSFSFS